MSSEKDMHVGDKHKFFASRWEPYCLAYKFQWCRTVYASIEYDQCFCYSLESVISYLDACKNVNILPSLCM